MYTRKQIYDLTWELICDISQRAKIELNRKEPNIKYIKQVLSSIESILDKDYGDAVNVKELLNLTDKKDTKGFDLKKEANRYRRFNDGWFSYFVNIDTGEPKFKLGDSDILVVE